MAELQRGCWRLDCASVDHVGFPNTEGYVFGDLYKGLVLYMMGLLGCPIYAKTRGLRHQNHHGSC